MSWDLKCNRCNHYFKQYKYWSNVFDCSCNNYLEFECGKISKFNIYFDNKRFVFGEDYGYYSALSDGLGKTIYFGESKKLNFYIFPEIKDNVLQVKEFVKKINNLLILS